MTGSHQPGHMMLDFLGTFGPYTHEPKSCTELAASCISRRVWLITRPLGHFTAHCSRFGLHYTLHCNCWIGRIWDWSSCDISAMHTYQHIGLGITLHVQ